MSPDTSSQLLLWTKNAAGILCSNSATTSTMSINTTANKCRPTPTQCTLAFFFRSRAVGYSRI
eukprot:3937574-Rhodomonas_salina.2